MVVLGESQLLYSENVKWKYLNRVDEVEFLRVALCFDLTYVAVAVHDVPVEGDLLDVGALCHQSWQINTESKKSNKSAGVQVSQDFWEGSKLQNLRFNGHDGKTQTHAKIYKVCLFDTFEAVCELGAALHHIGSDGDVRASSLQQAQYLDVHLACIQIRENCCHSVLFLIVILFCS